MVENLEIKLKEVIKNVLGTELGNINENSHFVKDLGADSLDSFQMVNDVEDAFDIKIPDADVPKLQTYGELRDYIIQKAK